MSELSLQLVPNRECGTCTVCCYALPIDTPEMRKGSGVVCEHCDGRGCRIYATRPNNCREFYCGWRVLPHLGDDWRPDICGVLVSPQGENIPAHYELREGIEFMILGGEAAVTRPGFAEFVANLIHRRVPVFFAVPGPTGTVAARAFANDILAPIVARRHLGELVSGLIGMLEAARTHRHVPDVFVNSNA
jgi:hypothetical protein